MSRKPITICVNANGTGSLVIDGTDISKHVTGMTLTSSPRQRTTTLFLDLLPDRADVTGDVGEVRIPAGLTELLVKLGWTPPGAVG